MDLNPIPGSNSELRSLLEENIKLSKEILAATQKTRRYIMWGQVGGYLKLLLIVVPLVLGYLYLRPYLAQSLNMARELMGAGTMQTPDGASGGTDIMSILQELRKQGVLPAQPTPAK